MHLKSYNYYSLIYIIVSSDAVPEDQFLGDPPPIGNPPPPPPPDIQYDQEFEDEVSVTYIELALTRVVKVSEIHLFIVEKVCINFSFSKSTANSF